MPRILKNYFLMIRWQSLRMKVILPFFVIIQIMVGIGTIIGFSYIIPNIDVSTALFIATGGPALTLMAIGLVLVPEMIAEDKEKGIFEYLWSLPISRLVFLLADLTIWTLATLPGVVLSLLVGSLYYEFQMNISILIVPAFLLVAATSIVIGYAVAYASPKAQITFLICNVVIYSLFLFSPINYPIERLPSVLIAVHRILPIKYMADLIRGNLTNLPVGNIGIAFVIVLGWFILCFFITYKIISRRR
ncbi:MAG: ABC transporter permease [Clostridia bacterium]|nr:ABC transporter permease [Clostridia bacterium]